MKAIIYQSFAQAQAALQQCNENIDRGSFENYGSGPFVPPDPNAPYTKILKHPDEDLWALVADEKVELELGQEAVVLDMTWFPRVPLV